MRRRTLFLGLALTLFLALGVHAKPFVPKDDSVVVETLPIKPFDPAQRELRAVRAALSKSPNNLPLALQLARQYVVMGRTTGDPRYSSYAQAALAPWWAKDNAPTEVLLLRATLRQRVHDFDTALADLAEVLQRAPDNAQARLTRATIYQVKGEFARAAQECEALSAHAQSVVVLACAQTVSSLTGQIEPAYRSLLDAVESKVTDPGLQAWLLTGLAEMAERRGDLGRAELHFKQALALDPEDVYLLGAYADLLIGQMRYREVRELLRAKLQSDPLLLRYAIASVRSGAADAKQQVEQLNVRFTASRMRGDRVHLREEARFTLHLLNSSSTALELAKENWRIQKEPADARILLESALAARDTAAIHSMREWLKQTRMQDVVIEKMLREAV